MKGVCLQFKTSGTECAAQKVKFLIFNFNFQFLKVQFLIFNFLISPVTKTFYLVLMSY